MRREEKYNWHTETARTALSAFGTNLEMFSLGLNAVLSATWLGLVCGFFFFCSTGCFFSCVIRIYQISSQLKLPKSRCIDSLRWIRWEALQFVGEILVTSEGSTTSQDQSRESLWRACANGKKFDPKCPVSSFREMPRKNYLD